MSEAKPPKKSPNLKSKGGARFPRVGLKDAIGYAKRLASKTHTGAQPRATIFPGVFDVNPQSTAGEVRASALKQYGLLDGNPEGYEATSLAKKIASATAEDLPSLCSEAFLQPKLFRILFDTFQGDTVSIARLRQQAASSGVHPDTAQSCAELFAEGASFASLAEVSADGIRLAAAKTQPFPEATVDPEANEEESLDGEVLSSTAQKDERPSGGEGAPSARSVIHVNLTLDSSLDTEKLEKQLALLRRYGAI